MSDISRRVVSGDPISGFPAGAMNYMMEGARLAHRTKSGVAPGGGYNSDDKGVIHVKNSTVTDPLPAYSILGINDEVVFDEADNQDTYRAAPTLVGDTPDEDLHVGKFCVTLAPMPADASGPAVAVGVVYAKVNVTHESHGFADIADGETGFLASGFSGYAQILRKPSGTGLLDCVLRMPGCAIPPRVAKSVEYIFQEEFGSVRNHTSGTPGEIYPAYARLGDVESGSWCYTFHIGGAWEIVNAECPNEESSSSDEVPSE